MSCQSSGSPHRAWDQKKTQMFAVVYNSLPAVLHWSTVGSEAVWLKIPWKACHALRLFEKSLNVPKTSSFGSLITGVLRFRQVRFWNPGVPQESLPKGPRPLSRDLEDIGIFGFLTEEKSRRSETWEEHKRNRKGPEVTKLDKLANFKQKCMKYFTFKSSRVFEEIGKKWLFIEKVKFVEIGGICKYGFFPGW